MAVSPLLRAKERARLPADFIVTTKKPQWQCVLKSMPSLELVFVHIDFYTAFEQTTLQTQTAHYYYTQKFLDPLNRNFWKNLIRINLFFSYAALGALIRGNIKAKLESFFVLQTVCFYFGCVLVVVFKGTPLFCARRGRCVWLL
jgi:hypothetical protein